MKMSHLEPGGCWGPTFILWKGTPGITGRRAEGMAYAETNFSGTLTTPTTTISSTIQGPYCEAPGSVYWCFQVALFRLVFLFTCVPSASSCRPSLCFRLSLGSYAHLLVDAVILLRPTSHSKFLTGEQTMATAPTHVYMRTGCWIPTRAATTGA